MESRQSFSRLTRLRACEARALHTRGSRLQRFPPKTTVLQSKEAVSPLTFPSLRSTLSGQFYNLLAVILPALTENHNSLLLCWSIAGDFPFNIIEWEGSSGSLHYLIYWITLLSYFKYCLWQWLFFYGSHCLLHCKGYITQIWRISEFQPYYQKPLSVCLDLNLLFFSLFGPPKPLGQNQIYCPLLLYLPVAVFCRKINGQEE